MKANQNYRPKKRGPSRTDTQATLRSQIEVPALLDWETRQNELPSYSGTGSEGGVSAEIHVEAGTKEAAKKLAAAHKTQEKWERMRKRAYACIEHKEVPDNPQFPDGPKHLDGKLLRLLYNTEQEQEDIFRKIDRQVRPFYRACQAFGLKFLHDSGGLWFQVCLWTTAAKNGNPRTRHLMDSIFTAVLWTGKGSPKRLTDEQAKENKRKITLQAKQDCRTIKYFDHLCAIHQERTAKLDPKALEGRAQVANDIITQAQSRGGPAKEEAIRLFSELVKSDLAGRQERTVRNNSR